VLLAASPVRPVTTLIPIHLLIRTVPIYSRAFFLQQNAPTQSSVKGWTYVRQGVYWCSRALDKYARGGRVWKFDVDGWRESGRKGRGWGVPMEGEDESEDEDGQGSEFQAGSEEGDGSEREGTESPDEEDEKDRDDESDDDGVEIRTKKGKRQAIGSAPRKPKRIKQTAAPRKAKRVPHPISSSSRLPLSVLSPVELPTDPYQRALRLLHVGATPESLPCREEEFVDVLSKVEEGVEGGGAGCLCEIGHSSEVEQLMRVDIAGVPGTGKTATVHAVVKELKRKAEDGVCVLASCSSVKLIRGNYRNFPRSHMSRSTVSRSLLLSTHIPSSGSLSLAPKAVVRRQLCAAWNRISGEKLWMRAVHEDIPCQSSHDLRRRRLIGGSVVLMDELDQLLTTKQDVVYNFFNWPTMADSQLFVIAVANRMDLPQHLAAKIKSRLGAPYIPRISVQADRYSGLQTLLFQPYDRTALIEIVQSRLIPHPNSKAEHKVLVPDAIALAATKMAGTNGDARRVLDACR